MLFSFAVRRVLSFFPLFSFPWSLSSSSSSSACCCDDELSSISSSSSSSSSHPSACTRGLTKKVCAGIVTRHFIYLIIEIFQGISSRLVRKKHNFFFDSSVLGTIDKTLCAGVHFFSFSFSRSDMSAEIEHGWNNNHHVDDRRRKRRRKTHSISKSTIIESKTFS